MARCHCREPERDDAVALVVWQRRSFVPLEPLRRAQYVWCFRVNPTLMREAVVRRDERRLTNSRHKGDGRDYLRRIRDEHRG